jgi:energy-coupling factor transporter ATP-binding protein EcfA2
MDREKTMIAIKELSFKYAGSDKLAIENISLNIEDGDFVGIIGKSGAGKTTLSYALNGIVPHHYRGDFYGEVLINGADTVESTPEIISRPAIAL